MAEILFPALFILLALGLPVAFAMAIAVFAALSLGSNYPHIVVVKEMFSGLTAFRCWPCRSSSSPPRS